MYTNHYIVKSLELHLFFGRIMKEHALFLKAGFTPVNTAHAGQAEFYKSEFEKLLSRAVTLSDGVVSRTVLSSGEVFTDYTAMAEKQTETLTGIGIDKDITQRQMRLSPASRQGNLHPNLYHGVRQLNCRALELLNGLIAFKEEILSNVLCCKQFTMNYPLLIEHILREAKLYREYITALENTGCLTDRSMQDVECFWNRIMMEHAQFIRGLLDPSEAALIDTAHDFSCEYAKLLETCNRAHTETMRSAALEETLRFRDFKAAGTEGIGQCNIRSVILPLLADHVLREANHYIRLLKA